MRETEANAPEVYADESRTTDEEESDAGEKGESAGEDEGDGEEETGDDESNRQTTFGSGDIEGALKHLDFDGSYYFHKEFTNAPNPALHISGLEQLKLPRRRQVRFENPSWRKWIGNVMRDVRNGLGVDTAQSNPYCDLYKLLLYEKGSRFLPHQYSEKSDGMFATLIIILPSQFAGGAVYLSHGGDSVLIDSIINSPSSTSVLAWYSDVTHAIQPVTSGNRLARAYNMVHAPPNSSSRQTSIPRLPPTNTAVRRLRGAFLAWRDRMFERGVPMKIISLLKHEYTQAELTREGRTVLKGIDAYIITHLERVAREYDFRLGLANLECHVDGVPEAPGMDDRYYCDPDPDASEEEEEGSHEWVMEEVLEQYMTITGLVDLMGQGILPQVEHGTDTQMIPKALEDTVIEGTPDDEEFEDYQGNWGPSLALVPPHRRRHLAGSPP